jgi:tetratricopeptide (TPR) repeat protein
MCAGYVRTEALPVFALGQGSEPIRSFTVSGRGTRKSPLEGREGRSLTRFVGREREISVLVDILPEVEAGRGQLVGFVGEPGVGKSRLLYELRNRVQERNFRYLEARCLSYGIAMPYLPILDMLRAICGISEEDRHDEIVSKVTALQGAADVDTDHLPYLLLLLGVREGTEPLREMSPETVKARTFQAVIRLVLQQSGRQPLALAIEDLHWIDKTSEELLSSLSGSITGAPILMLTTYRPGYRPPWMDQSYATQLSLRPLSMEESRAVVESALPDRPISDEIARSIVRKGDGNPFFLEELARSVGEQAFEQLPDTVQGVLLARIDRLSEPAKRLLQTASVLGREASLRLLREIHDQPESMESDLEELKRQEFVYERGEGRERLIVFKHVLTQEAAYDSLLSGRRMGLHEAAGAALERLYEDRLEDQYEQLAYHYACTANADKAFEYLVRANEKAIQADAPVEAKGYFQRAMALLDTLPESEPNRRRRLTLLAGQIVLFQNLFQMQEYYDLLARYEPIAKELGDAALLGSIVQQLGHCDWTFGRFERAHERFTEAAALLEATGNYTGAAQTYQIWMWNHLCRGNFDEVLALQERAEIAWAKQPNLRWYVYALCAAGLAYGYLGRFQEGIDVTLKALSVAERFNDAAQVSFAAWSVAQTYFAQGDLDGAMEYGEMGVEKAPTPAERAWAEGSLAAVRCRAGQLDEVIAVLAPLYEGLRAARFVPGERFAPYLGEAYLRIGDFERARDALARGLEVQERHGMRYEAALTRRLLGELALASNPRQIDPPWAEPLLKACQVAFEEMNAQPELTRTWEVIGRLRARQDQ